MRAILFLFITSFLTGTESLEPTDCWCDFQMNKCDINCCCDRDCSEIVKQVFSECIEPFRKFDLDLCFSSDVLIGNNNSYGEIVENEGLFCIVRKNLKERREFKPRSTVSNLKEFKKLENSQKRFKFELNHERDPLPAFGYDIMKKGSPIWILYGENLQILELPVQTFGNLCLARKAARFLTDENIKCQISDSLVLNKFIFGISQSRLLTSPNVLNKTDLAKNLKDCLDMGLCLTPNIQFCNPNCSVYNDSTKLALKTGIVEINIIHNGTEGIKDVQVKIKQNFGLLTIRIRYLTLEEPINPQVRSGNPGYLPSASIPFGNKIPRISNSSEEILLSGYLTLTGSPDCLNSRIRLKFGINMLLQCTFKVALNENLTCLDLNEIILNLLQPENFTEAFVPSFGAFRTDYLNDWTPILITNSHLPSTEQNPAGIFCNLIKAMDITILFALTGDSANPQSKILGIQYEFVPSKVLYQCLSPFCKNISVIILETSVNFVDVSKPAVREIAQPPGINVRFPHDFFYPFFAGNGNFHDLDSLLCALTLVIYLWV